MRLTFDLTDQSGTIRKPEFSVGWTSPINKIIWIHVGCYALYVLACFVGLVSEAWSVNDVMTFVRDYIALPGTARERALPWPLGLLTYQFAHRNPLEFLVSLGVMWFSGHLLKEYIGERRVVVLYFVIAAVAALMFLFAHIVFPVYSGHHTFMEGALPGALGVFTVTMTVQWRSLVRISGIPLPLRAVYAVVLLMAFTILNQHSLASVLMYVCAIWAGLQYASMKLSKKEFVEAGTEQE